jgi:hypothetical protein
VKSAIGNSTQFALVMQPFGEKILAANPGFDNTRSQLSRRQVYTCDGPITTPQTTGRKTHIFSWLLIWA